MTRELKKFPDDFDTWPPSAQAAYQALFERTQAAENIIYTMQSTFSDEDSVSSLLEQDLTPSWRTIMLHTLNDLFRKAAMTLDLQEVLQTITRIVTQMLQATSTYICDWDAQHKTITVLNEFVSEFANEAEQHSDVGQSFTLTEDFIFRLTRQEYWISHYDDALDPTVRGEFDKYNIKTVLYVPLVAEDTLIGHIEIWETRQKQDYSERQIEFVTALAGQTASIVRTTQLHRALKESEARFRLVMSTMREGLVQVDENGIIEFANERFGQFLGYKSEELIGHSLSSVLEIEIGSHSYEIDLAHASGTETLVHISYAPINNVNGIYQGAVYVFTDVSKRKQAEQSALELGLEKERVRILTEFVQDASHEFYTPLSNIGTHAYLLGRHLQDENLLRYLDIINEQSEAIRSLISALVIMTRLDGLNSLQFRKANMVELVVSVLNRHKEHANQKSHELKLDLPEENIPVDCDVDMLLLAISNVMDNAIRYTPAKGLIAIELKQENRKVILIIGDTGIGMSKAVQEQIFKRFYREDSAHSTRGFGLGMTITKRIVELHYGDIQVKSEKAQGTRVSITLPLGKLKEYQPAK